MKLKVISLNIWQGNLLDEVIDFLRQEAADIVLLQEVYNAGPSMPRRYQCLAELRQALIYEHQVFAESYNEERPEGLVPQGNAIFSRHPITASERLYFVQPTQASYPHTEENFPHFPRSLLIARINTPAGEIMVGNMHGVWDLAGDNPSPAREHMVDVTLRAVAQSERVIVGGDTNAKPTNPALQPLARELRSVFPDLTTTFNMRRKSNPGYATAAVDHLYVSNHMTVVQAACPDIDVSDHLPLIATLEIN